MVAPAVIPANEAIAADPEAQAYSAGLRYQITFAARVCQGFNKLMAGRVRDDQVESVQLPGRPSLYRDGQPVDPDTEARGNDGCQPLTGWRFTMGSGHTRQTNLSTVTDPVGESGQTQDQVIRLDQGGTATQDAITGAVSVVLSPAQLDLAVHRRLWVQGGSPADPYLGRTDLAFGALRCAVDGRSGGNVQWIGFPAGVQHVLCYAYYVRGPVQQGTVVVKARATRAIGYQQRFAFTSSFGYAPNGAFALTSQGDTAETSFVRAAGTRQQVTAATPAGWRLTSLACATTGGVLSTPVGSSPAQSTASAGTSPSRSPSQVPSAKPTQPAPTVPAPPTFPAPPTSTTAPSTTPAPSQTSASASSSADPSGVPQGARVRARQAPALGGAAALGGVPALGGAAVAEVPKGEVPRGEVPRGEVPTVDQSTGRANLTVLAGQTVTCTYTFEPPPAGGPGLSLRMFGAGGSGTFTLAVTGAAGNPVQGFASARATVAGNGSAVAVTGYDPAAVAPDTYNVTVVPPGEGWRLDGASCSGIDIAPSAFTVRIPLISGGAVECVLRVERLRPSLTLRVATSGWVGTAGFVVAPADRAESGIAATGTTEINDRPVDMAAESSVPPAAGGYVITPLAPVTTQEGSWRLQNLGCTPDGVLGVAAGGAGALPLSLPSGTGVSCTAYYRFVPATRVQIVLSASGTRSARSGAAILQIACADGSSGQVVLPARDFTKRALPVALTFLDPTRCTVVQPDSGLARKGALDTELTVDPDRRVAKVLPLVLDIDAATSAYTVVVHERFTVPERRGGPMTLVASFDLIPVAIGVSALFGVVVLFGLLLVVRWHPRPRRGSMP